MTYAHHRHLIKLGDTGVQKWPVFDVVSGPCLWTRVLWCSVLSLPHEAYLSRVTSGAWSSLLQNSPGQSPSGLFPPNTNVVSDVCTLFGSWFCLSRLPKTLSFIFMGTTAHLLFRLKSVC